MTLRQRIEQDLVTSMKSRDAERLSVLRFLLSAIKYKEVDKKSDLSDSEIVEAVSKQVKTHKESVESFKKGNRPDLVLKEESELKILESYLPAQMSEDDLRSLIIQKIKELEVSDQKLEVGEAMRAIMPALRGQADGAAVEKIVEEVLKAG